MSYYDRRFPIFVLSGRSFRQAILIGLGIPFALAVVGSLIVMAFI